MTADEYGGEWADDLVVDELVAWMTIDADGAQRETLDEVLARLRPGWMADAACKGQTVLFFPEQGGLDRRWRTICASCPVQRQCADYVMAAPPSVDGCWAGMTALDRRRLRRERREAA